LFRVDPHSSVPVFEQIVHEVKGAVASGAIRPGEPIPSVRKLAVDILVNPNTVAKAYRELEREGLIYTKRGLGFFVSEGVEAACKEDFLDRFRSEAERLVTQALRAGIAPETLFDAFEQVMQDRNTPGQNKGEPA